MRSFGVSNVLTGKALIPGSVTATVAKLEEPISYWGGMDTETASVIDVHNPQCGIRITGKIMVLPSTKGSTAGPGAMLEIISSGNGPVAFIVLSADICTLIAASVAHEVSSIHTPVIQVDHHQFEQIHHGETWCLEGSTLVRITYNLDA